MGAPARRCCWPRRAPGERVLDLGCGAGRFLAALRDAGAEPVGVEIAEAAVERARTNVPGADVRLLEPDGTIPAAHGEFDLVWCSEVLEHIPDVGAALFEVRRVLKPGGRLLATVPHVSRARALLRFEQRRSTRWASTCASSRAARWRARLRRRVSSR